MQTEDQATARDMLRYALARVQQLDTLEEQIEAWRDIATAQAQAGDQEGAQTTFRHALEKVHQLDRQDRIQRLRAIAVAQAHAGLREECMQTTELISTDRT